jgi:hypothetical protein
MDEWLALAVLGDARSSTGRHFCGTGENFYGNLCRSLCFNSVNRADQFGGKDASSLDTNSD